MTTLADMRNRITDELTNEDISVTQIDRAINSAIAVYERRNWWFNDRRIVFYTEAGTERYASLTTADFEDILHVDSVMISTGLTDKTMLRPASYTDIQEMQPGDVQGYPTHYTFYNYKFYFYPIPDAVYRVLLSYAYKFDVLTLETDTNAWLVEGEELIRQSAKRRLALDVLHDEALAQRCAVIERDALDAMLAENRRRQTVKTLSVDPMFRMGGSYISYQG